MFGKGNQLSPSPLFGLLVNPVANVKQVVALDVRGRSICCFARHYVPCIADGADMYQRDVVQKYLG